MIRLLDDSANEGLTLLKQMLNKGEHELGSMWINQLSPADQTDLSAVNTVLPGLNAQFQTATASDLAQLPTIVDRQLLEGTTINFSRSLQGNIAVSGQRRRCNGPV